MDTKSRPWYHCNARKIPDPLDPADKRLQSRLLNQLNSRLPTSNRRDEFFTLENLKIQEHEINRLLPLVRRLTKNPNTPKSPPAPLAVM